MDCIGSVLSVERYQRRYYLNLHFNPSAGCLLILNSNLQVEKTLPGGTEAFIGGGMLWYMNMVHFADVHPEELWMYNPKNQKSQRVYPQAHDPFRKDFSERLAKVIDRKKCMANNWACDAQRFSCELGKIAVDNDTRSFAFQMSFSAEGFESMKDAENSVEDYVYVYRLDPFSWREFSTDDLSSNFGTDSLQDLLNPEMLRKVFAAAK
jgi:hypothetical protein